MKSISRRGILITVGIIIFILPWIGVPLSQKYVLAHILGVVIVLGAWRKGSVPAKIVSSVQEQEPAYVDNADNFSY